MMLVETHNNYIPMLSFQSLGCDKKLGSIFSFDNCRVCGGDNSTCHEVSGQLETSHLAFGMVANVVFKLFFIKQYEAADIRLLVI